MKYFIVAVSMCIGTLLFYTIAAIIGNQDWPAAANVCYNQTSACLVCYLMIEKPWRKLKCLN